MPAGQFLTMPEDHRSRSHGSMVAIPSSFDQERQDRMKVLLADPEQHIYSFVLGAEASAEEEAGWANVTRHLGTRVTPQALNSEPPLSLTDCGLKRSSSFMMLTPQVLSDRQRIDCMPLPPFSFIPRGMVFGVMNGTEGNGEFIAHLEPEPFRLGIADMVSLGGRPAADETWLTRDEAQMLLGANALWLAQSKDAFVDLGWCCPSGGSRTPCWCEAFVLGDRLCFRLRECDGAGFQVVYKSAGIQCPITLSVQGPDRVDVVLPYGEQQLDIDRFGHGRLEGF
jgi:hypothetical protein